MNISIRMSIIILCVLFAFKSTASAQQKKPNIIFISVDDMNDWTTLFNDNNPIQTPNLKKLAQRGAFFTHAYASSPSCNPSRASVMTGTRPHKTGVYGNSSDWRGALPKATTIQQYFAKNGYYVGGAGKIFHHHFDWAFHDHKSFHEFLLMKINEPYPPAKLNKLDWYGTKNTDWGTWPQTIEETADYKTAEYAKEFLKMDHNKPFFLNVGIYKPHSPFFAPKRFFDLYPKTDLVLPEVMAKGWQFTSGAKDLLKPAEWFYLGMKKAVSESPAAYQDFVRSYQAASSFADFSIGEVIQALDNSKYKDNTIIVLWSDHGFHIGEKEHIEKFALWEKTTHVPLIFIAPGQIAPGIKIDKPVDLTTLYPTLIDLAGLNKKSDLDGKSLTPLFSNPNTDFPPALMTYMKGNHAIRKDKWRYIKYNDGSQELYNLADDPYEWNNLAGNTKYSAIIRELSSYMPKENAEQVSDLTEN